MNHPFKIKTIASSSEFRLKEKDSIFIGKSFPISNEEESAQKLNDIRKQYYDATHNCFAYKLVDNIKYSDDGEPNGTAGIRILNAINHFDFTNILVVVTRYFGGTKLGVGLLGKTYYDTAYGCLKISQQLTKILYTPALITYQFEFSNLIHRTISKYSVIVEKTFFNEYPQIECLIPSEIKEKFTNELAVQSINQIRIKTSNKEEYR